jgi:hypothetical protein
MGGIVANKGPYRTVRQIVVDAQMLDKIADALGIPRADLAGAESVHIHVGTPSPPPTPPGGRTP